jgi:hypothetical protein
LKKISIKLRHFGDLPAAPDFCPHFGFIVSIWNKVLTVEPIAGVYL